MTPSPFAAAFRQHAMPRLRALLLELLTETAPEDLSYAALVDPLMALGFRLGAGRLPEPYLEAFENWVANNCAELLDAALAARDRAERVAREFADYEAAWLAASRV